MFREDKEKSFPSVMTRKTDGEAQYLESGGNRLRNAGIVQAMVIQGICMHQLTNDGRRLLIQRSSKVLVPGEDQPKAAKERLQCWILQQPIDHPSP